MMGLYEETDERRLELIDRLGKGHGLRGKIAANDEKVAVDAFLLVMRKQ